MAWVGRLTSVWVTCEAGSLGDATGSGLGSLGPSQSLAKGKGYSSQFSVHQRQWVQNDCSPKVEKQERLGFLLQSMSPGTGLHPTL